MVSFPPPALFELRPVRGEHRWAAMPGRPWGVRLQQVGSLWMLTKGTVLPRRNSWSKLRTLFFRQGTRILHDTSMASERRAEICRQGRGVQQRLSYETVFLPSSSSGWSSQNPRLPEAGRDLWRSTRG